MPQPLFLTISILSCLIMLLYEELSKIQMVFAIRTVVPLCIQCLQQFTSYSKFIPSTASCYAVQNTDAIIGPLLQLKHRCYVKNTQHDEPMQLNLQRWSSQMLRKVVIFITVVLLKQTAIVTVFFSEETIASLIQ